MLKWDYVPGAGFKGARNVRNGDLGGAATKAAFITHEGHMVNDKGVRCITGYHELSNSRKAALIKREGHMVNAKGVLRITGYHKLGEKGNMARGKKCNTIALGEHHLHICTSAICQSGASITWEKGFPKIQHHCCDPEQSGLTEQKARKVKVLGLHICKKCHRTAQECKGTCCLASSCRSNSLKLCQHLHQKAISQQHYEQQLPVLQPQPCCRAHRGLAAWHQQAGATASSYANISTRRLFCSSIINSNCRKKMCFQKNPLNGLMTSHERDLSLLEMFESSISCSPTPSTTPPRSLA